MPNALMNATPMNRPEIVLLLQPWSTSIAQTTKSRMVTTARPFSSISPSYLLFRWRSAYFAALPPDITVTCVTALSERRNSQDESELCWRLARASFVRVRRFISVTLQNRQSGIFGKARIGRRPQALIENGTAVGFDHAQEPAIGTQTDPGRRRRLFLLAHH